MVVLHQMGSLWRPPWHSNAQRSNGGPILLRGTHWLQSCYNSRSTWQSVAAGKGALYNIFQGFTFITLHAHSSLDVKKSAGAKGESNRRNKPWRVMSSPYSGM